MKYNTAEQDRAVIIFRQMGAKVKTINGVQCYIRFYLDNKLELYYVYNVTKDGELYLQRIKPYPFGAGVFMSHNDIIEFISNDIKKFKNASNSKVFEIFIKNNKKINDLIQSVESLFLENNVPKEQMEVLSKMLEDVDNKIVELLETTPKI
ncbi:MAG: hypothetical protein ACOWWH_10405 [Eubacteriaceae bacterium]